MAEDGDDGVVFRRQFAGSVRAVTTLVSVYSGSRWFECFHR
ncbi:hypothetical protein Hanom_Chr03g00235691 [Helianthus anomalus]